MVRICWGGEEFILVTAHVNAEQLKALAEKLRKMVMAMKMPFDEGITVSVGATLAEVSDSILTITDRVDKALYCAKNCGRNKTSMILKHEYVSGKDCDCQH